eukprot:scaffold4173_cov170-Ochromonas_danica.AAC.1
MLCTAKTNNSKTRPDYLFVFLLTQAKQSHSPNKLKQSVLTWGYESSIYDSYYWKALVKSLSIVIEC